MKPYLPYILIFSRLAIGLILVTISLLQVTHYPVIAVTLLTVGLLTDIFDGIIARQLNISTVDQLFFIAVVFATYLECPTFFKAHQAMLAWLIGAEVLTYAISFMKFRKEIATHSIGAKLWTLILFATLVQIIMQCEAGLLFRLCFWAGLVTRLEIIAIILTLRQWTNDVPSIYHAIRLRQNKPIKRNKLFNG